MRILVCLAAGVVSTFVEAWTYPVARIFAKAAPGAAVGGVPPPPFTLPDPVALVLESDPQFMRLARAGYSATGPLDRPPAGWPMKISSYTTAHAIGRQREVAQLVHVNVRDVETFFEWQDPAEGSDSRMQVASGEGEQPWAQVLVEEVRQEVGASGYRSITAVDWEFGWPDTEHEPDVVAAGDAVQNAGNAACDSRVADCPGVAGVCVECAGVWSVVVSGGVIRGGDAGEVAGAAWAVWWVQL